MTDIIILTRKKSLFPQNKYRWNFMKFRFLFFQSEIFKGFDKFFCWMIDICSDAKFRIRIEKFN